MKEMTVEQWLNEYQPTPNMFNLNASWQDENGYGCMFETYGDELNYIQHVMQHEPNRVWTYADGDDGSLVISSGYSLVNRIGYFITERPWTEQTLVIVEEAQPYFDDEEMLNACDEAGLPVMAPVFRVVFDRGKVYADTLNRLSDSDFQTIYQQFLAPAIDQIEDYLIKEWKP